MFLLSRLKRIFSKPHLRLIALVGIIVPRRLRADWRQEWESELTHREALLADWERLDWRNKRDLLWRSSSAFWDALWLQTYRWEDALIQDLRYGLRILARKPAFTLAAVLSLAVGIGANTALFSVVNAVLWRPLPYSHAERLVRVGDWSTAAEFVAIGEARHLFDGLGAWSARDFTLTGRGMPAPLKGRLVTSDLLPLLGVTPQIGRGFNAQEFQPGHAQVALINANLWRSRAQVTSLITQLSERLRGLPGVESVSAADSLPLSAIGSFGSISIEGRPDLAAKPDDLPFGVSPPPPPTGMPGFGFVGPSAFFSRVTSNYFRTLGIPLRQGREFDEHDQRGSAPVAIVNEAMAHHYWPGKNPIGKRLMSDGQGTWRTVIGVVGNVKRFALEDKPTPEFYLPLLQQVEDSGLENSGGAADKPKKGAKPGRKKKVEDTGKEEMVGFTMLVRPTANQRLSSHVSLMLRTTGPPEAAAESVRETVNA